MLWKKKARASTKPERILKGLQRKRAFLKVLASRKTSATLAGATIAAGATGGYLATRGQYGKGTLSLGVGALLNSAYLLLPKAIKSLNRIDASLIGRPALAARVLKKEKNAEKRANIIALAELPFVKIPSRIVIVPKGHTKRIVQWAPRIRIFSIEEINELRNFIKKAGSDATQWSMRIEHMQKEKTAIEQLAAKDPELMKTVWKTLVGIRGIDAGTREGAVPIVEQCLEGYSKIPINFRDSNDEITSTGFMRLTKKPNGTWDMKMVIKNLDK